MSDLTRSRPGWHAAEAAREATTRLCLAIVWSHDEPGRVGEVIVGPGPRERGVIGRGSEAVEGATRLAVARVRPGSTRPTGPLTGQGISRVALRLSLAGERLAVERAGRAGLRVNGRLVERSEVGPGDLVAIDGELSTLVVEREVADRADDESAFAFGEADAFGLVGESACAWQLREELRFYAERDAHALIVGPSGAGKELAARALHGLSSRKNRPFVARSAATLPSGIIDAELFGNARNYPNAGMRERAGMVGEADGGTLFLDEIGELSEALQAHLLRLLDGGEYHRLGDDRAMKADLRLIGATNRPAETLKHDLLARLKVRVSVPGLDERRDDIPLIARHLLRGIERSDPRLAARFFVRGHARLAPDLMDGLLRHRYQTHARELESLLLLSMATSKGDFLALTPRVEERLSLAPQELSRQDIEDALERAGGNVSQAFRALGLSSRDALNRLIKKHQIEVDRLRR